MIYANNIFEIATFGQFEEGLNALLHLELTKNCYDLQEIGLEGGIFL